MRIKGHYKNSAERITTIEDYVATHGESPSAKKLNKKDIVSVEQMYSLQ